MGLIAGVTSFFAGCSSSRAAESPKNVGDYIVARLQSGMTDAEVGAVVSGFGKAIESDGIGAIPSEAYLFMLYGFDYQPRDVLKNIEIGSPYRVLMYKTNPAGGQSGSLHLFFDEKTKKLNGWVNYPSQYSREKFLHERLTSQIRCKSYDQRGMTHAQVYSLIGRPNEVVIPPRRPLRAQYENHFWVESAPVLDIVKELEVYVYPLGNGQQRRVYLAYYKKADELVAWGYDHAWEEADRYIKEQGSNKKQ